MSTQHHFLNFPAFHFHRSNDLHTKPERNYSIISAHRGFWPHHTPQQLNFCLHGLLPRSLELMIYCSLFSLVIRIWALDWKWWQKEKLITLGDSGRTENMAHVSEQISESCVIENETWPNWCWKAFFCAVFHRGKRHNNYFLAITHLQNVQNTQNMTYNKS